MLREYTCIICPNGCDIRAQIEEREDGSRRICSVEGAACPKGRAYVEQELTDPQRNIATSVLVTAVTVCVFGAAAKTGVSRLSTIIRAITNAMTAKIFCLSFCF